MSDPRLDRQNEESSAGVVLAPLRLALEERYTIEAELGGGGMSLVFLARDVRHARRVVIKVLPPELTHSLGAERFLREIRTTAKLNHPHIVPLHDSGEADGLLYYVTPFMEGESLADRIRREGPLPVRRALHITREVADALSYAHAQGVVHRDVKPGNILLLGQGHACVADFGLARALHTAANRQLTATGLTIGSPHYMSPEQIEDASRVDARSDTYGLGCVLYEMLSGSPPFTGETIQEIFTKHLLEAPPPLRPRRSDVPPKVERALLRALAKAPAERFASTAEFGRALRVAPKQPISTATPPKPGKGPAMRIARLPGLVPTVRIAGLVGLLALVTVGVTWVRRAPAPSAATITVVTLPLDARNAATVPGRTAEALQELLSSGVEIAPGMRVSDGASLLKPGRSWRSYPISSLLAGARDLQGRYLAVTEVIPENPDRITLDLYDVNSGERVLHGVGGGKSEGIGAAMQRLSLDAVRTIAQRDHLDLGFVGRLLTATNSPAAISDLVEARELLWAGNTDAAVTGFQRAIAADSGFAPAYFYLSTAELWEPRWDHDAALAAAEAGLTHRVAMPSRWARLLEAQRHYVRREGDDAIQDFHHLTVEDPNFAEAWFGLGEAHFHLSGYVGLGPSSSFPAFARLVAVDSSFALPFAYAHLVDAALWSGNVAEARRLAPHVKSNLDRRARELVLALQFGTPTERAAALHSLRSEDSRVLSQVIYLTANRPTLMDTVARAFTDPSRPASDRQIGARFRLVALAAAGRWRDGIEAWRGVIYPTEFDPWIIHAYLAGYPADSLAAPMFRWARNAIATAGPLDFVHPDVFRTQAFRALANRALLAGDSVETELLLRRLKGANAARSDPEPDGLRLTLKARRALLAGDTVDATSLLERALARAPWSAESYYRPLTDAAPQRLLLAKLYARRGSPERSRLWAHSFGNTLAVGDVLFVPAASAILNAPGRPKGADSPGLHRAQLLP
jgi:hypothetical protein